MTKMESYQMHKKDDLCRREKKKEGAAMYREHTKTIKIGSIFGIIIFLLCFLFPFPADIPKLTAPGLPEHRFYIYSHILEFHGNNLF